MYFVPQLYLPLSLQNYFDKLKFVREKIDGDKLIENLASQLKQRFQEKVEVVNQIRIAVENAYSNGLVTTVETFPECCKVEPTVKDYRFRTKVMFDKLCENRASSVAPKPKHMPKSVLDTMIKNFNEKSNVRWQFFGSQEGIYHNFPALKYPDCSSFDNRVRPWYVQGISPEPKDIVIVIDRSSSMTETHGGKTLMEIAVGAASTVLDSVNPKDRVRNHHNKNKSKE